MMQFIGKGCVTKVTKIKGQRIKDKVKSLKVKVKSKKLCG